MRSSFLLCFACFALGGANMAFGYDVKTCLVEKVVRHEPRFAAYNNATNFPILGDKLWAYTWIDSAHQPPKRITHLWLRNGIIIDRIERPVRQGLRMYSNKKISSAHLGNWELRAIDQDGMVLNSTSFEVAELDNKIQATMSEPTSNRCDLNLKTRSLAETPPTENPTDTPVGEQTPPVNTFTKDASEERVLENNQANSVNSQVQVEPASEAVPSEDIAEQQDVDNRTSRSWRVGADLGMAIPFEDMVDDLDAGQTANIFFAKRIHALPLPTLLSLNMGFADFSGDKNDQKNKATDTNISLMLSSFYPLSEKWSVFGGFGGGVSLWTAKADGPGGSHENKGSDPSLDLIFGLEYHLKSSFSALISARARKTFDKFNVTYVPLTIGFSYDFGGEL